MSDNPIAPVSKLRYCSSAALLNVSLLPSPDSLLVLPSVPIPSVIPLEYPTLVLEELVAMFHCHAQSVMIPQSDDALHSFVSFEHVSREQRDRCKRVEMVHHLTHAHDDALCHALDTGAYPLANITSSDVRLNRRLRGPCISCVSAKQHDKSRPTSQSAPVTFVSQFVSVDT